MSELLDLSNNNGGVSFVALRARGIRGVWHKASEGETFVDKRYAERRKQARRARMLFGAYHFAIPRRGDAHAQADHFVRVVRASRRCELRPVLDLETNPHNLARAELVEWARTFTHRVAGLLGVWPLFYSYPAFIHDLATGRPIGAGLWLASYGPNDGRRHPASVPAPWRMMVAHQYTSNARLLGVSGPCDRTYAPRLAPLLAKR